METKPYLIFSLHGVYYGIESNLVQEVFLLPELSPIAEAPDDIVGILNLRGQILPMMHLNLRLGKHQAECILSDSAIVLASEGLQIGIIVNSVYEVKDINSEAIESEISYGREKDINIRFIAGVAKVDADTIILLNAEKLIHYSETIETLLVDEADNDLNEEFTEEFTNTQLFNQHDKAQKNLNVFNSFYERCCPHATAEERGIFRERAENLRQPLESLDLTGLMSLAVIGLNGEYFGLDLEVVREIINLHNITPIPCCPPHIIGNINLRGEIVTLVDIRSALKIPIATSTTSKAIVIQADDVVAGLPVDEVFDVMYLHPSNVMSIPAALHSSDNEFLRGTAPFDEKMLSVIDLPKILSNGGLAVNQKV